jgi:hypothetical protein
MEIPNRRRRPKAVSPLPLCHRTPGRFATFDSLGKRASVLDWGRPSAVYYRNAAQSACLTGD